MNKHDFKRSCSMESRLHFAQMECRTLMLYNTDPGRIADKYASIDCDLVQCILDLRESRNSIREIGINGVISWGMTCEAIWEIEGWIAWVKGCRDALKYIAHESIARCGHP